MRSSLEANTVLIYSCACVLGYFRHLSEKMLVLFTVLTEL